MEMKNFDSIFLSLRQGRNRRDDFVDRDEVLCLYQHRMLRRETTGLKVEMVATTVSIAKEERKPYGFEEAELRLRVEIRVFKT